MTKANETNETQKMKSNETLIKLEEKLKKEQMYRLTTLTAEFWQNLNDKEQEIN